MRFLEIRTPVANVTTVRVKGSSAQQFQPASTGDDSDSLLRIKAGMEKLEMDASAYQKPGFISSAAHTDKRKAVQNAQFEAIERLSLAAWWAFRRPVLARANDKFIQKLMSTYQVDQQKLQFSVGYVESVCNAGYVAVSILENRSDFPFIVLGGGCSGNANNAAKKAFFESIQSWAASVWLRENSPNSPPYWDIAELRRRADNISNSRSISLRDADRLKPHNLAQFFSDKQTHVESHPEGYVVWVYLKEPLEGYSYELAEKVKKQGEKVCVLTQYNY